MEALQFNHGFAERGVEVIHNYAKETRIPAGVSLSQHVHPFEHKSYLQSGHVRVIAGGISSVHHAPKWLTMAAGVEHEVIAITDAVWLCVWPMSVLDEKEIDAELVATGRITA